MSNDEYEENSNYVTGSIVKVLAKRKKGLQICHLNAQSLRPKIDEFRWIFENSNVDIICISETWLDNSTPNGLVSLSGYRIFRSDRTTGRGGGVAIYVRDHITCKLCMETGEGVKVEHIFVEISSFGTKMLVGCAYRPNSSVEYSNFIADIEDYVLRYNDVLIAGDFNSNLLGESTFKDEMTSIGLIPINTSFPTHFTGNSCTLLDIMFVGDTTKILLYDQVSASCFSKHDIIYATYDFQLGYRDRTFCFRDFANIDYNKLYENILQVNWDCIYSMVSVDEQLSFLEYNILRLYDEVVPIRVKTITAARKPWFNSIVSESIKRRDLAYFRWKRFRTHELKMVFKSARRDTNSLIKRIKSDYYSTKFGSALESKRTWRTIKDIGIAGKEEGVDCSIDADELNDKFVNNTPTVDVVEESESSSVSDHTDLFGLNMFGFTCVSQFDVYSSIARIKSNAIGFDNVHPKFIRMMLPDLLPYITYFFNTIITTSCFPLKWKHARIIPVPKANNEFRPIAILGFLSKALEKILHGQISTYIFENKLLSDRQSGFRQNHSCVTTLVDVAENIRRELDGGKINFLVLLDHSKAFDTVDHGILLRKLKSMFNFSLTAAKLMLSYLTDRTQSVCVNNTVSTPMRLTRGVPQGSILGPLLFSMYVNDLPGNLSHCNVHMYADDVQLWLSSPAYCVTENIGKLNDDLDKIYWWATRNRLYLNPLKSKCLVIRRKTMHLSMEYDIVINQRRLQMVDTARNLGIVFDNNLTWSSHINSLVASLYTRLRTLWTVQYLTPLRVRVLLAKAYLVPCLSYGCELFSCCDSISRRKLEVLFNNIVRYVYGLKRRDRVSLHAKTLLGVSIENFLKIRTLIFFHKIIYTQRPEYLFQKITFARSARGRNIIVPRHQCLVSEWQFFPHAIRLWNALPHNKQIISNAANFRKFLFDHFN